MVYLRYFLGLWVIHVIIYFALEFIVWEERAEEYDKYIMWFFWALIIIWFILIWLSKQ